jgi:glycosyltransferase involved in cell wall biosynthesis
MVTHLANLLRSEKELQLICVGGSAFDEHERAQFSALGLTDKIHYRIVSSDEELANVYHQASCFIFPSQYEGFGIPVLEAFACNCPAVLNRASSLPEVGGNAAVYFEENKPETLEAAVRSILEDSEYRKNLVSKGAERAKQFTWEHSAAKHLAVYQAIIQ